MPRIEGSLHRISKEELLAKKKQAAEDTLKAKEAAARAADQARATKASSPARGTNPSPHDPAATSDISPEAKELAAQGGEAPAKPVISPADDPPGVKMEKARAFLNNPRLPPEQRKVLEEIVNKK